MENQKYGKLLTPDIKIHRLKPHCKNKIWVNNGVINKRIDKSEIEIFMGKNTDFVFGMISRK